MNKKKVATFLHLYIGRIFLLLGYISVCWIIFSGFPLKEALGGIAVFSSVILLFRGISFLVDWIEKNREKDDE